MIIEEKEITNQNDEPLIYTVSYVADFVAEAIAKEREACAKVCEDLVAQHELHSNFICARTIRARGEK